MIDPGWKAPPVLLTHHKGRKRIHLEIVDRFSKASDLKRKMVGVFKDTVSSISTLVESYTYVVYQTRHDSQFSLEIQLPQQQQQQQQRQKLNIPMMMKVISHSFVSLQWKIFVFRYSYL